MIQTLVRTTPFLSLAFICGCTTAPRIETAADLIARLQSTGIQVASQEQAPKPTDSHFRFDEGIRIRGPELFADVLRIEDRRVFDIAKSAGRLLVVAEAVAGQPIPENPDVFARHPFVVVIRQQPPAAPLEPVLAKLLPPESQ
ncbi:MAG: hypothetical protein SGI88_21965 [Candidatus Hydrogenedentes bacterium]|nr:hypothetical protein [Candidatus Hydrogenedentota bacterium]